MKVQAQLERMIRATRDGERIDAAQAALQGADIEPADVPRLIDALHGREGALEALIARYGERPIRSGRVRGEPRQTPQMLAHAPPDVVPMLLSIRAQALAADNVGLGRARALGEQPALQAIARREGFPPAATLRLDDVLNFLMSAEGRPLSERFFAHAEARGVDPTDLPFEAPEHGQDLLSRGIGAYFLLRHHEGNLRDAVPREEALIITPHAVLSALLTAATRDGFVNLADAVQAFGEEAKPLLLELGRSLEWGQRETLNPRRGLKYRYLDPASAAAVSASAPIGDLDARVSGFWKIVDAFGSPEALKNVVIGLSGHLTKTISVLARALIASGGELAAALGKHYSAQPETLHEMERLGARVSLANRADHDHESPEDANPHHHFLLILLQRLLADPKALALILDDGFLNIGAAFDNLSPVIAHRCVGGEQTERGALNGEAYLGEGKEFAFNVLLLARSILKKLLEGPPIGECIVWHVEQMLREAHPELKIEPKEAVVAGYGTVGRATVAALERRGYTVRVIDKSPAKVIEAAEMGLDVGEIPLELARRKLSLSTSELQHDEEWQAALRQARRNIYPHGHLAINCTPNRGFSRGHFHLFPDGNVFANGGSGTHWIDSVAPVERGSGWAWKRAREAHRAGEDIDGRNYVLAAEGLLGYRHSPEARDMLSEDPQEWIDPEGQRYTRFRGLTIHCGDAAGRERNFHRVIRDDVDDEDAKEHLVLYGGSVVNLKYGLPPEYVQITLSALYLGALFAVRTKDEEPKGFRELPLAVQRRAIEILVQDLDEKGLSIANPDFNRTPPIIE